MRCFLMQVVTIRKCLTSISTFSWKKNEKQAEKKEPFQPKKIKTKALPDIHLILFGLVSAQIFVQFGDA